MSEFQRLHFDKRSSAGTAGNFTRQRRRKTYNSSQLPGISSPHNVTKHRFLIPHFQKYFS
jgi:hypothetical protein